MHYNYVQFSQIGSHIFTCLFHGTYIPMGAMGIIIQILMVELEKSDESNFDN